MFKKWFLDNFLFRFTLINTIGWLIANSEKMWIPKVQKNLKTVS